MDRNQSLTILNGFITAIVITLLVGLSDKVDGVENQVIENNVPDIKAKLENDRIQFSDRITNLRDSMRQEFRDFEHDLDSVDEKVDEIRNMIIVICVHEKIQGCTVS